ncbi:aldolase [Haematobacter missouriensis]|uniref:Aldolase n=2 Tax=Haematobacter missouriensis TaxID=366616 RepID=A0A212ALC3_9RHOB|nr:aldolase [Haematobacter missouriensis]OWJ82282.1 aldolase [Haematobacter missouriensis]
MAGAAGMADPCRDALFPLAGALAPLSRERLIAGIADPQNRRPSVSQERTASRFRARLRAGAFMAGTFIKTPASEIVEIMAQAGVDFICLDAEHSALGRRELDWCLALARALDLPTLVRLSHASPEAALQALDGGASGLLVPHVRSPALAADVARWARFGAGGRGYAGSTRHGDFTARPMADFLAAAGEEVSVIAQIEDPEALDQVEAIAATPGIDGVFFGAADLGVGLGLGRSSGAEIDRAFGRVASAAQASGRAFGAYGATPSALAGLRARGASLALIGSDQGMVLAGARALAAASDLQDERITA